MFCLQALFNAVNVLILLNWNLPLMPLVLLYCILHVICTMALKHHLKLHFLNMYFSSSFS